MIKDKRYLTLFERQLISDEAVDFYKNLEIYEAMWLEAVELGIFPLKDPLDGVEDDIHLARVLNQQPRKGAPGRNV